MTTPQFEAFLAKIYVDAEARRAFVADPMREALSAGLTAAEASELAQMDFTGLELAADSFAHKRAGKRRSIVRELWDSLMLFRL